MLFGNCKKVHIFGGHSKIIELTRLVRSSKIKFFQNLLFVKALNRLF